MQEKPENQTPQHISLRSNEKAFQPTSSEEFLATAAALNLQHRLFMRELGSLIPDVLAAEHIQDVLDVFCAAGAWSLHFNNLYPGRQIVGVDTNPGMINVARELAALTPFPPTYLEVKTMEGLPFESNSFDFIHMQDALRFLTKTQWPLVMQELYRVLRPGGWLQLLDLEPGLFSSDAMDRVIMLLSQALEKTEKSIAPGGNAPYTMLVKTPQLLYQAGFMNVSYQLYPINFGGWNNQMGRSYVTAMIAGHSFGNNVLTCTDMSIKEEIEALLKSAHQEVQWMDFCGAGMLLSVIGAK